ncbi:MAG TPA: MBOAT family protein [Symbiobacteriaceae bacterium]|nr:MBOAT family protein [Symbiobacteriaceae bacterium]
MLFNSYRFIFVFLPVVLAAYWATPSLKARKWISLIASYIFYGAWDYRFALLMLGTTSVDYFTARFIQAATNQQRRKHWLIVSMVCNLGVLGIFKYYNFFASSLNAVVPQGVLPYLHVILPMGISFYTFESMSYTIDVYWERIPALQRFVDYAHFVTMFPRLVAGPIARYSEMAEQLKALPRFLPAADVAEAIHFFTMGLVKKVLIADYLAGHLVNPLFQATDSLGFLSGWVAVLSYSAQLYLDFSGYSDMAVGLGLLLGFRLPRNFMLPYASTSIAEFWRRWHISLSTWLRDYLYIPLGGNRQGEGRSRFNLFMTMLLGGLWHGANWTFVLWGAYHGLALAVHRVTRKHFPAMPRWVNIAGTFLVVAMGWVMFRANSMAEAWHVYRSLLGLNGLVGPAWVLQAGAALVLLVLGLGISFTTDTYEFKPRFGRGWAVACGLLLTVCVARFYAPSPFLYFQF